MSLTVNGSTASSIAPIEAGSHLAVCSMLIDLGDQYSEKYAKSYRKILVGWEIPGQTIELEDGPHPRTISKIYTASLGEKAALRRDLAAWRGRDFTAQELAAFDLRSIVGASCFISVIHADGQNGRTYANISSIMALPKGTPKAQLSEPPIVFDLDKDPLGQVDTLPEWISKIIKDSSTYKERAEMEASQPTKFDEFTEDDGDDLPF